MTFRLLTSEEISTIAHEFESRESPAPGPDATIMGAFEGTQMLAFWTIQLAIHAEPMVVYDRHAVAGLVAETEKYLQSRFGEITYFALTEGRMTQLAKHFGMTRREETLMEKRLHGIS